MPVTALGRAYYKETTRRGPGLSQQRQPGCFRPRDAARGRAARRDLLVVAQRLDDVEHLFVGDEAAAVRELVAVDGRGQIAGIVRQVFVRVRKLPALAVGPAYARVVAPAVDEHARRFQNRRGGFQGLTHLKGSFEFRPFGRRTAGRTTAQDARVAWPDKKR